MFMNFVKVSPSVVVKDPLTSHWLSEYNVVLINIKKQNKYKIK
jgi:hypothetical protein